MLGGKLESLELPWYVGMMLRVAMQLLLRDHVSKIGRGRRRRVRWLLTLLGWAALG